MQDNPINRRKLDKAFRNIFKKGKRISHDKTQYKILEITITNHYYDIQLLNKNKIFESYLTKDHFLKSIDDIDVYEIKDKVFTSLEHSGNLDTSRKPLYDADVFPIGVDHQALFSFDCLFNLIEQLPDNLQTQMQNAFNYIKLIHKTPAKKVHIQNSKLTNVKLLSLLEDGYSIDTTDNLTLNKHTVDFEEVKNNKSYLTQLRKKVALNARAHKAGMTLLEYHKQHYMLFGFDDAQYFGCLLPLGKKPRTVHQALECLKPEEVGKHYQRQGEWFIVPCESIDYVKDWRYEYIRMYPEHNEKITGILPKDTQNSNNHLFTCDVVLVLDQDKFYFRNLKLKHTEHQPISVIGDCYVIKNKARVSVSSDGVD